MKRIILALIGLAVCLIPVSANAAPLNVGDRVYVSSVNEYGNIINIDPTNGLVKVHLDRFGNFPSAGVSYDPRMVKITVVPAGTNQPGAANGSNQTPGGQPLPPANPGGTAVAKFNVGDRVYLTQFSEYATVTEGNGPSGMVRVLRDRFANIPGQGTLVDPSRIVRAQDAPQKPTDNPAGPKPGSQLTGGFREPVQVPNDAQPSEATFKNIIKSSAGVPNTSTIYVDFPSFQYLGTDTFNNAYGGNVDQGNRILGGPGDVYSGWKYHVKYVATERYDDPLADDKVRVFEGDYLFFRDKNGQWFGKSGNARMLSNSSVKKS